MPTKRQDSSSQAGRDHACQDLASDRKDTSAASIRAAASLGELAAAALLAPDAVLLSPRLAGLDEAEQEAFLSLLSPQARLLLALSEDCPAWIRSFAEGATLFLEIYRHRNFLLEDMIFEAEETCCQLIARAEGRVRYRFEASLADCLVPDHAEGLRQLLQATVDPSQMDPEDTIWVPDILEFGSLAEKDMEETEFVGIAVSCGQAHAVIDCRDDDPSELIEATKRLLELSSDPEGFSQLLARLDHKEINDVQMQLQEALGDEQDHPLFGFDTIDAALDMDNDEGWRWWNYLAGETSEPMLMMILQHLDALATTISQANGDGDDDDEGEGWEPSYSILAADSPFQRLLGGADSSQDLYSFELKSLQLSS